MLKGSESENLKPPPMYEIKSVPFHLNNQRLDTEIPV